MARRRPTEPSVNPARGAALVVVAVLLGLVLLRNGIDTSEVVTSSNGDDSSTDAGDAEEGTDAGTGEGEEDTPTTVAVRPPAEVSVIVLNGTSVSGAAGKYSTAIGTAGYQMLDPGDAPTKIPTTQVFFTPGFEQEAAAVALAAGAPGTVTPVPLTSPPPGEVGAANVVVVIGADLASLTPTTAASAPTTAAN
ncbi:MAG: LytR C-terminal domain-containing protein [Acidimicrobiales bacterium]